MIKKIILLLFLSSSVFLWAQTKILSPVAGVWGNPQALLIDVEENAEVYYSTSGIDPMMFGFAYDGPVVIEKTGDVRVKITVISSSGLRQDYEVDYTVKSPDREMYDSYTSDEKKFVKWVNENPLRGYTSGTSFYIPDTFLYAIGCESENQRLRFFPGRSLSISKSNTFERYVPFTVTDGSNYFRFILKTLVANKVYKKSVYSPFYFSEWNTISFLESDYEYKLDDGLVFDSVYPCHVDRDETHVFFWRKKGDVNFQNLVLYPIPSLVSTYESDGECWFDLSLPKPYLAGFSLGAAQKSNFGILNAYDGLYESLCIDSFYGEDLSDVCSVGVYYNGLYQGSLSACIEMDRLPPVPPVITVTDEDVTKDYVSVSIKSEDEAFTYYCVSENDMEYKDYFLLEDTSFALHGKNGQGTSYTVTAFSRDKAGNIGDSVSANILVDGYNIYVSSKGSDSTGNGTKLSPFSSLEKAITLVNSISDAKKTMTVHINGQLSVDKQISINNNCIIEGNDAVLVLSNDANISVSSCNVCIENCSFVKDISFDSYMFLCNDSSLTFENCDISANFASSGALLCAENSSLIFQKSNLSSICSAISNVLRVKNCDVVAQKSIFTSQAYTSSCLFSENSELNFSSCVCTIVGRFGHIIESVGGDLSLYNNKFSLAIDDSSNVLYLSKDVNVKKNMNNYINGVRQ